MWPKSLLLLEAAESTPTSTQPQQGMNINTPPTQLASAIVLGDSGRGEEEAPLVADDVAIDEDDDDDDTQQYLNTGTYDNEGLMAQQYEYSGFEHLESVAERIIDDLLVAKKHRKRPSKGNKAASMIQPPQQPRVQGHIPIPGAVKWHIPGEPILSKAAVEATHGDLRLHDDVLRREKSLIASENPGYALYMVNVSRQRSYVDTFPAEKFFLRFDYIFDMFHLKKLDFKFVCLYASYMNYIIGIEQIPYICVADPYFMHEAFLAVYAEHCEYARDYIVDFLSPTRTRA